MSSNAVTESRCDREPRFALMAMASFLLYALGVLALHQDQRPGWAIEAAGPIPAAVSYLVYGTPFGALDDNVMRKFWDRGNSTVQQVLGTTAKGSVPRGQVDMYSFDGIGAGSNVFAIVAMWMFGTNISSLVLFYLCFVGASVFIFLLRYKDDRVFFILLYFLATTAMLFTPLCTSAAAVDQMPIGGNRYFSLATYVPALHIFFELTESSHASGFKLRVYNLLLLFVQGILFFGALLVRSSAGYLLGALFVALILRLFKARKRRDQLISLVSATAAVSTALVFWIMLIAATLPAYVQSGRVLGNVWHRAFISFALEPGWPFGNLQEVYDCTKYIPEGLSSKNMDRVGHCIWSAYPPNAIRSPTEVSKEVYGSVYEKTLRNAYFYVLFHYPKKAFELYMSVKSRLVEKILTQALKYLYSPAPALFIKGLGVIATAQFLLSVWFIISATLGNSPLFGGRLLIFPIALVLSIAPLYVAWASPWTTADTVVLMYACLALAALLVLRVLGMMIRLTQSIPVAVTLKGD